MFPEIFCHLLPARLAALSALSLALSTPLLAAQTLPAAESGAFPGKAAPAIASQQDDENSSSATSEEGLRQRLVGKNLYLREGWLADSLEFDRNGGLAGNSPRGSYTLSILKVERLRLTKSKLMIEGARYGLHFLGQLASEQSDTAVNRVRITPPKKRVRITIERLKVVPPKKKKGPFEEPKAIPTENVQERPSTASPAHAARVLDHALDRIFAPELDNRQLAALPRFWQLYYQAASQHTAYHPADPAVLHQNAVDRKPRLLKPIEPVSNEYAQAAGVAGMALYQVVVDTEGRVAEIAVTRPIGFGLDENAVEAILKARFEPAIKDEKTVPVLLELVAQFRIYSQRTAKTAQREPAGALFPGPYAVQ